MEVITDNTWNDTKKPVVSASFVKLSEYNLWHATKSQKTKQRGMSVANPRVYAWNAWSLTLKEYKKVWLSSAGNDGIFWEDNTL